MCIQLKYKHPPSINDFTVNVLYGITNKVADYRSNSMLY